MADWKGARYDAGWLYRRIKWGTWDELGLYDNIESASINRSAFDTLKTSGSLNYFGTAPDEVDALALVYTFRDRNGQTVEQRRATVLVESDEPDYTSLDDGGVRQSGTAKLYSLLKVLSDTKLKVPYTVAAGTNAIAAANRIITGAGLRTNCQSSGYLLSCDHTFAPDDSLLDVVNYLLDAAGYGSADTDAYGTVILKPYVEPTARELAWTFANDETSTLMPGISSENDWRNTPNIVVLTYETDDETYVAQARNIDPESRASLPSRSWRENSTVEQVSELDGETQEERLENLKALARKKLLDSSSEIQYTKVKTLLVPVEINDAAGVLYSGIKRQGAITSIDTSCTPTAETNIKIREFIRRDLLVDVSGQVIAA